MAAEGKKLSLRFAAGQAERFKLHCFPDIPVGHPAYSDRCAPESHTFKRTRLGRAESVCREDFSPGDPEDEERTDSPSSLSVEDREKAAYRRGFCDGQRDGLAEGEKKGYECGVGSIDPLRESLHLILEDLGGLRRQAYREMEQEIVRLALKIARMVVHREVNWPNDIVVETLRQMTSMLESPERITVRLNPADVQLLQDGGGNLPRLIPNMERVTFKAEETITRGGCYIETDMGDIDARIESQLRVAEDIFNREFEKANPAGGNECEDGRPCPSSATDKGRQTTLAPADDASSDAS